MLFRYFLVFVTLSGKVIFVHSENDSYPLKDNWLAYWRHEIGLPDADRDIHFNQIELQSFTGHTAAIRCRATWRYLFLFNGF